MEIELQVFLSSVNDHFHIPVIQRPGKETMLPLDMRMDGPQSRSVHTGEKKIRSDARVQNSNRKTYN
jgi:hypothetical protein